MLPQEMMHAAIVHEFGQPLSLDEIAIPTPNEKQVLINVIACGCCHTDLHAINGDWPVKPKLPFSPGHEVVGRVAKIGNGVTTVGVGDIVGIAWTHMTCEACEFCLSGRENLCKAQTTTGYSVAGGFSEYTLAEEHFCVRIPDTLSPLQAAPILCAGLTVYRGLRATNARAGQWVAIVGIGGLGHLAVQYAVAMGFRVVAVDIADDKLESAKRCGAEMALNSTQCPSGVDTVIQQSIGGCHAALVTAVSPKAMEQTLSALRNGGTVVLVGLPKGDIKLNVFDTVFRGITVRGSIVGTRRDLVEALDFASRGLVKAEVEPVHLRDVNEVFERLVHGKFTGRMVFSIKEE
jgi:propanol-preferring alcohol dehydrogenase